MGKVYAVHGDRKNETKKAERFGSIVTINHRYVYPDELTPTGELPPFFKIKMAKASAEFNLAEDYLLMYGDHLQLMYFSSILSARGPYRVLRYDKHIDDFVPVLIKIPGLHDRSAA